MEVHNTTVEGQVRWQDLTLDVVAWNRTNLAKDMPIEPFPPGEGTLEWDSFNTLNLSAWHMEASGSSLVMDPEDHIGVMGLTETHGGARLTLRIQGVIAYVIILPGTLLS